MLLIEHKHFWFWRAVIFRFQMEGVQLSFKRGIVGQQIELDNVTYVRCAVDNALLEQLEGVQWILIAKI